MNLCWISEVAKEKPVVHFYTHFHTLFILISLAVCQWDGEKPLIRVLENAIQAPLQSAQSVREIQGRDESRCVTR